MLGAQRLWQAVISATIVAGGAGMLHVGRSSSDVLTRRQRVPESSTKGGTPRLSTQEPREQTPTDWVLQPVGDGSGPRGASREV